MKNFKNTDFVILNQIMFFISTMVRVRLKALTSLTQAANIPAEAVLI